MGERLVEVIEARSWKREARQAAGKNNQ